MATQALPFQLNDGWQVKRHSVVLGVGLWVSVAAGSQVPPTHRWAIDGAVLRTACAGSGAQATVRLSQAGGFVAPLVQAQSSSAVPSQSSSS